MKIIKIVFIILALTVVIIGGLILKTFRDAGEFRKIEPHFDGTFKTIEGVLSSEDITIHPQTGMAFISSADNRGPALGKRAQGAIMGYPLLSPDPQLVNLTAGFEKEFNPHGLGLFVGEDGESSLFVVNHNEEGHFVEIFDYKGEELVHRRSVHGELMHSPNDVVPVDRNRFYVTNDHGSITGRGRMLEEYLQLSRSYVLFYDGRDFKKVADGLTYANGINLSLDGKAVYVASTVGGTVHVYDRDLTSGDLTLKQKIACDSGVDNIEVDQSGNLWIGAHPKLLTFVEYSKNPQKLSPSQAIKVSFTKNEGYLVEEVFVDAGENLSGSSVAAVFRDSMLVGSVFDSRFLLCKFQDSGR